MTPGDPEGIGPEICGKLWAKKFGKIKSPPLLFIGAEEPLLKHGIPSHHILAVPDGKPGFQAGWAIEEAFRIIKNGKALALVTGPIHKKRLQAGGYPYEGHTDFLADLAQVKQVTMMMANDQLRVSLATIHCALKEVSMKLNTRELRTTILQTTQALVRFWGIRKPKISVLGLNPHAGEEGLFGTEERRIILPAIRAAQQANPLAKIKGPVPADTYFALKHSDDAVIAMYHDQGLIPAKLLDFKHTVNVTLGLPFIRTSVDHGTAFDIAGKGIADPSSLEAAYDLAIKLAKGSSKNVKEQFKSKVAK